MIENINAGNGVQQNKNITNQKNDDAALGEKDEIQWVIILTVVIVF